MMIDVRSQDDITILSLARSQKRNALTPGMLADLERAVRGVSSRAVLLTGEGECFCAGFDLSLCRDDDSVLESLLRGLSSCVRALRECACPVVVSAHGAAIAGGCALLGGCDIVVTDSGAKLGYPVLPLGVSPAVSGPTLNALVGFGAARRLLLEPRVIDGREALRVGLAHECAASVVACKLRAEQVAGALASKPAHAVVATRAWLREIDSGTERGMDGALRASLSLVNGPEQRAMLPVVWTKRG